MRETRPRPRPGTSIGTRRLVVVPSPSCPYAFQPQHLIPPAPSSAQVWSRPAYSAFTPLPSPTTSTGVERDTCVPSPSRPLPLNPQHFTPPLAVSAHAWRSPTAIAPAPLVRPRT